MRLALKTLSKVWIRYLMEDNGSPWAAVTITNLDCGE